MELTFTQSFNELSNDFQRHPIVALMVWTAHFAGAIFFTYTDTIYSWHIPPIITEVMQNLCYFGGACVSYLALYPTVKKMFKKK